MPLLDTIQHYTPLGLRFWDTATESRVEEALRVRVWPEATPRRVAEGRRTEGRDVAVHGIAGLRNVEFGGDVDAAPPAPYVVQVDDPTGRFLSMTFRVDLPRSERGFFTLARPESPPDETPPGIYLFSAPTRPVPATLASVQATLRDADTGEPAAHAVVHVELDDAPDDNVPPGDRAWVGMANADGAMNVLFPYPRIQLLPRASPPDDGQPLSLQTWPIRVTVHYDPTSQDVPPGADVPTLPSLVDQDPSQIVTRVDPDVESGHVTATLRHRVPCVLRTDGLDADRRGLLFVRPAA